MLESFYKLLLKSTYFDSLKNLSFNFSGRRRSRRKGIKSTKLSANTLTSFDNTRKWQKVGQIMNLQFAIDTQDRDEINQGKFGGHCSSLRQVNKADWRLNCAFVIPVGAGAGFGQISFQSTNQGLFRGGISKSSQYFLLLSGTHLLLSD